MTSREWTVKVYRITDSQEPCLTATVTAPNWLTAENIALDEAMETFGGDDTDDECEAEER